MRLLLLIVLLIAAVAVGASPPAEPLAAVAGAAAVADRLPDPPADPFPLARVPVSADRLGEALAAADPGPVERLTRAGFERRVQAAGRAEADRRSPPRVVEARYTADWADGDLAGRAEWDVVNPRPRPAALPLDPLRAALRGATWAGGGPALVGVLGRPFPPGPAVWVPAGRHTLAADWTAAGAAGAFDLRLPPSPAAVLDLTLPAGHVPVAAGEVLRTGPTPAANGRQGWRFRFGGRPRLEFAVRGPDDAGPGAVRAALAARFDLTPGQVACTFDWTLTPARPRVAGWRFAVPPGVRVTDAEASDRVGWRVDPATGELRLTLRQPGAGGKVRIEAVAPVPAGGGPLTLPVVRPVGAVVGDERLDVRVHPELTVQDIDSPDYRLADLGTGADDARTLSLVASRPAADGPADRAYRRPPVLRVAAAGPAFATREGVEWRVAAGRPVVVARVGVTVRRGPLFRLTLAAPPGYELDRAVGRPDDLIGYAGPADGGAVVEFARPLAAGRSAELVLTFRGPPLATGEAARLPFPGVAPFGAAERDGWVAVGPAPGWAVTARPDPGAAEASAFDPPEPPPPDDAAVTYLYRGREPGGELLLTPVEAKPPAPPPPPAPLPPAPPAGGWRFDGLSLVTLATDPPAAVFGGVVVTRGGPALDLRLPPGATPESVRVGDRLLDPAGWGAGPELRVTVPAGAGPVPFEVRYRLPKAWEFARRLVSPPPELPGDPGPVRRWWAFPADVVPVWPVDVRPESVGALPTAVGDGAVGLTATAHPGPLVVVPGRAADAAGWAVAAVLAAAGWATRRGGRWRLLPLLGALALVVVVGRSGPPGWWRAAKPPAVAGVVTVTAVAAWRNRPRPIGRPAAALVVLPVTLLTLTAQPERSGATVWVVGDEVVAPRALLDRLDALARHPDPAAVVTSAAYDGRAEDGLARFAARFTVHTAADGETPVTLPLADARLEAATVDGKPAAPQAPRPGVVTVAVAGRGPHAVELRFAVPVTATGPERDVRFGVPEVPDARLLFAAPAGAAGPQAVGRFGGQQVAPDGRLAADLGGVRQVHLKWRQGAGGPPAVAVREGCVWEVSEADDRLTACYLLTVGAGAVTDVRFDLPAELEPTRVAVQAVGAGAAAVGVRDWEVGPAAGGVRPLRVELAGPAEGRLLVTLEGVRRGPPTRRPVLRFPRPVGVESQGGLYGLRAARAVVDGVDRPAVAVDGVDRSGVIDFAPDALARDREFKDVSDLRLNPAVPLLTFSPRPGEAAELRPVVRPGPELPTATQEVTWRVSPRRADADGAVRWAGRDAVPVVEFALPGVAVAEVRGPEVAGWTAADGRVRVWLRRPAKSGAVAWTGTLTPRDGPAELSVPAVAGAVTMKVAPADGWAARADRPRGWAADPPAADRSVTLRADGPAPPYEDFRGHSSTSPASDTIGASPATTSPAA